MKKIIYFASLLAVALFSTSCQKKEVVGPAGQNGVNGKDGKDAVQNWSINKYYIASSDFVLSSSKTYFQAELTAPSISDNTLLVQLSANIDERNYAMPVSMANGVNLSYSYNTKTGKLYVMVAKNSNVTLSEANRPDGFWVTLQVLNK